MTADLIQYLSFYVRNLAQKLPAESPSIDWGFPRVLGRDNYL